MSPVPMTATVALCVVIASSPSCVARTIHTDHSRQRVLRMRHSRRALLGAGIGLVGAAAFRPFTSRAADLRFTSDPFTLGIASGYPEPSAVTLWTRLAPEPLVHGGGMPATAVDIAWELATDEHMRNVVRRGSARATPDGAHSVHV